MSFLDRLILAMVWDSNLTCLKLIFQLQSTLSNCYLFKCYFAISWGWYESTKEDILNTFGAYDVYEIIENDSKNNEVAIPNISFYQEHEPIKTLSTFLEQQ